MYILKEDLMKKRVLSLFMVLVLCLTLLPTAAFAEGEDVSISGGVIGGGETGGEGGGIYVAPGSPTEGGGGTYIPGEDTRTEIWCVSKPDSIGRGYDGTTDGGTIPIDLTFTDGTNEIKLKEGTGFTAKKTFDSADAGWHTVTVEIALIGEAAVKYKLKAGEETFTIGGNINKAYPDLTVTLSKTACTAGEKLLPLLSVEGAPEDAEVTYYYLASAFKSWAGSSDVEGSEAMPKIDENTAISEPGTYYVYAKTGETTNYEEDRSATVELTVNEAVVEAASITKADGTDGGTYESLPAALNAAQDGDTVKLLANHTTNWSDVEAGEYATLAVVKKTLTLDLNGMTVDYLTVGDVVPDEEGGILESYDGNLTVVDNAQGGSCGKIKDLEFVKGSLAIQGGRIGDSLTCDRNSGTVTISGGTVCNATVGDGAAVTVTGGTGHAGTWYNDGTLNITDGTFCNVKFLNNGGTIAISGGTFGTITNINGSSSIPLMPLLADNYAFYQGDNAQNSTEKTLTNVTVRPHTHSFENGKCDCGVAAIVVDNNNSCYNTLQAALDAAADNASITSVTLGQDLTKDITFSGSAAGSLTLNMNGHKLETEAGVPLTVTGGTLRIEGAGEINQNTASNATAFPAITLTGGKLVITGDLTAQGGYDSSSGRKPAIRAEGESELDLQGNVSLNGGLTMLDNAKLTNLLTKGTFYAQDPNGNATSDNVLAVCIQQEDVASDIYNTVLKLIADGYAIYKADGTVRNAAALTLKSDTYSIGAHTCNYTQDEAHGIAYCKCGRSHAHRDLSDEKSVLVNGVCPICGYHCPHKNIGDDGVCKDCNAKMVAEVTVGETTTYTADLADALNKAANGTTVKLLANEMLPDGIYVSKTLTLDLDGHSLSGYSLNVGGLTPTSQVRTGKLTVIDSSGGNGAVGVAVRDGGTLVFDPKNDNTTLLQLEVWGGTVELYGGKISRSGLRLNNNITLGNLLPQNAGLAYYCGDTQLTLAEAASKTCDLVVKTCAHGGKNGFDENATACPYCNAPAVAETALNNGEGNRLQRRFADLQTALDADRDGGATLQLLADVTGDYTIGGTKDTGLDLNGHSIKGTVTVKAAAGSNTTTLSNTKNTTTVSIDKVVAHKGAKLAGSRYPAVIGELTLAEGATWKNILNLKTLGYKVLNGDGTYKWYAPDDVEGSQLNNVIINSLPITTKTLNLKVDGKNLTGNSPKVERGTTVQLCASCNAKCADVYIYTGEIVGNNDPAYSRREAVYRKIGSSWYYVVDLPCNTIGKYSVYFTATKDGYTVQSSVKTLTVTKPNLSNAEITFRSSNESTYEPYRSTTTAPGFTVTYNGKTLKLGVDYTASGTASSAGVSTQTLTIKAVEGSDYTGSKTAEWRIVPHKAKVEVGDVIKAYDGTTDLPDGKISLVSAAGSAGYQAGLPLPLSEGNGFELTDAKYDSANASETEKNISFTVKLTDTNYTFEDSTTEKAFTLNGADFDDKTFQINKATVPMNNPIGTLNIINGTCQTYTYDFNNILPGLSKGKYGTISYGQADISLVSQSEYNYGASTAVSDRGVLTLAQFSAEDGKRTGRIGTVKVTVTTTNYENFQLKLVLNAVDQIKPEPDGTISASEITYGQALNDSSITGKMKDPNTGDAVNGTFAWTNGTIKPDANDRYEAEWTFTPAAGYEKYATATGTVTIKVKPAKLTVSVKASSAYYNGEAQIASIIASGQSVDSTPVAFTYSDKVDGNYTSGGPTFTDAGTYTAYYKAEAANHEPATGTFTVTIDPLPISLLSVSSISKTYDGSADVTLTADKLTFFSKTAKATNIKLPDTAITFTNARFTKQQADGSYLPSPEVGGGKALSFTMTLTSNNYVFEGKSEGTTKVSDVFATDDANRFTITKAAAPGSGLHPAVTVINDLAKTYEMVLSNDYLPKLSSPCEYGTVSYSLRGTYLTDGYKDTVQAEVVEENSQYKLKLTVPAVDYDKVSSVGTIDVRVTSDNYRDFYLTIGVKTKNKDVPVPDGPISASDITYGQALNDSKIAGKMKAGGKAIDGTFAWKDGTIKPDANDNYEAEWTFTPAAGYEKYATATGTVTIKVNKATPTFFAPTAQENLTYTGQEQALITAGMTDHGTMQYSLTENGTYSQDSPTGTDAGAYTVWYRVIGDANHNDTAPASVAVRIGKKPLTITGVTAASKPYDGTTNADISSVTFDNVTLNRGTDYTVTANFDDASVDSGKNITATVTLMEQAAKNYALEQSSFPTTGSIIKAAAPDFTKETALTIVNGHEKTYTVTLPALPTLETPKEYGAPTYELGEIKLNDGYYTSGAKVENGELTLPIQKNDVETTGSVGTVTVVIKSANYEDITLTVNVSAKNRITPTGTPTLSKNAIIYGDALNAIALSGKLHDNVNNVDVDGTFEWVDGTHIPVVGNGTYAAEWIFEPTDTEKYLTVSGRSNITVEKARQYGKLSMAGYTYGKTPSTPTLTDQTGDLNAQVTYSYAAADSGSVQTWDISNPPALNAGTYRMYASIGDTDNYYGFEAVYCEFVVAKATPTYTVPTGLTAKYGQTLADVTLPDGWSWMDSSESVGGASTAAKTFQAKFTPKDTENYNTVENIELEVTVNKADGGNLKTVELEQKYTDASDHTYTPDWAGLPAGQDWTFSSEASIVLPKQDFAADGNLLTYAISGGKAGDKITLILKASCDNYEDFIITLNVTLTEKDDQKPLTITGNTSVIYGEKLTLTTTGGSGMGAVTYRIDNAISTGEATIDPNTGVLTPVKVGSVSVIATKAGDNNYNDVTSAPFVLMIKPATPTGEPKYTKITTSGKTLKDVTLTIEGSTLNPSDGKLEWVDDKGEPLPDDTTVKANTTYKWCFTPDDDNYTTLTGEVELYHKSSSGGGWYDSCYTIKATAGAGGSISPSGNVSVREGGDQTFTITPDKGYAVANVKIDGKSIGAVKSYTFENVSSPHTIEAIFVKGTASASTGDSSNLPLWSTLLLASTLALAGAVHLKRKRAR